MPRDHARNKTKHAFLVTAKKVPGAGIEPARTYKVHRILSPACLPVPPSGYLVNELQKKSYRYFQ